MNIHSYPSEDAIRSKRRKLALSVLAISVVLHAVFALVAGVWIVVKRFSVPKETPPILSAKPIQKPPEKLREQAIQAAAFEGASSKSVFNDRILSTRLTNVPLPKMPSLPNFTPPSPDVSSASLSFQSEAIALAGGASAGMGVGGSGAGGTGAGVNFLGVKTNAKRIVLMFDISKTVAGAAAKLGMPMERIREETARLIEGLGVNTRFGLVEFARNYAFFKPDLVPSTSENRKIAVNWLNTFFATEGTLPKGVPNVVGGSPGFLVALEAVFRLQPDSVFIISDGSLQRGTGMTSTIPLLEIEQTLIRLQASQPTRAKVFFIGVGVQTEAEKSIKHLLANAGGGGTYSELKREPRSQ